MAIDDGPTKRYGHKVQGAGIHRNPTTIPDGAKFIYGHLWVAISAVVHHKLLLNKKVRKSTITVLIKCSFLKQLQIMASRIVVG